MTSTTQKKLVRKTVAKNPAAKPTTLLTLDKLQAHFDAGVEKILDRMTKMAVPAVPVLPSAVETGVENAAARLDAILTIFSGRQAQNILQDMLESGCAPSREQLLREADKLIAARGGK
ncbi:hypothetical protein HBDW_18920 [Herbaspirillum sp. DW155]|uniref:hypothetical protein n=1 Tax=Herbaspirillum sp. DW155 TaxID=3095609 RepID=UPI003085C8C3|nr:hypothetical protein HBDW_18920 [Herbaspirillum sp. DW155]